jgi:uncharacterized protein (AIM24 family)
LDSVATPAADREAIEQAVVRGSDLLKQGKLEDAQKAFRAALLLDADNPRVLALLGLAHFRGNQFEPARTIYEDLVERLPTDASHRLNLGLVYLKLGDATRAINSLEASRALDPSQGRAVSYLGLAYARAGRYAEAYRSFLLAGQNELASEIQSNLTAAERDGIHAQLLRSGVDAKPAPRTTPPTPPPPAKPAPAPAPEVEASVVAAEPAIPAPSMSESQQFVLPMRSGPVPVPTDGRSMISQAVDIATPTTAGTVVPGRTPDAARPPVPLSQLATEDLVRPDDGNDPFSITASGALCIRIKERVLARLDGVHAMGGDLAFEPAMRRSRGHQTDERFDYGGPQMHAVYGEGYLIAVPGPRAFTAVLLDDDIFYLREDLVFAFEATLRWENGNVPGLRGRLPVVQFRGDGAVALRSEKPLVRIKLPPQGIVFVDAARLAGWIGRVIPRAVVPPTGSPMGDVCVECTGEGVVLVDPVGDPGIQLAAPAEPAKEPRTEKHSSPPPPPGALVELDTLKSSLLEDDPDDKRDEI